ncbi:MAG: ATP-binding protein [Verrucomicrobiaceae bacterium]|nr:MAG: ATP-binding protein [Verrucomicrobiaceae bacterium]
MGIRRALGNLIGNAVKFSSSGESITISLHHEGSAVRIDVADEGPGIAAGDIPQLFEPYTTSGASPADGEKGTGLGLAIAKRLIEAHGGQIGVTSEPGQGSTFFIRLPLEN